MGGTGKAFALPVASDAIAPLPPTLRIRVCRIRQLQPSAGATVQGRVLATFEIRANFGA